jgi:uncharacterized protein
MYLMDTFTNFLSGLGVYGRDKMTAHAYTTQVWTRDQLEASFKSDWIARKAICIPAHDATREWRQWQAEANQIEKLEETEDRLHVQLKLQEALTKARLYGGSCILIGVDGNMAKELDPEKIKKDGLKFLHVFAPHQLAVQDLIKDIASPYYGQPEAYTLHDETGKWGSVDIHPSRMVRLIGLDPPDPMQNYGWGDPLMQTINDAVASAGTVAQSIAAMISEAKFDVVKIPGLTEIFSTTEGTTRLVKRFTEANVAKSVINAVVLDGEEEWQRIGVNFTGMPEILQMYLQIAAGAADVPVTRFVGMSPAGLNSTGESDLTNYYDRIKSDQELRLTPALEKLDIAIQRSALGRFDKNIFYEWNSLWQMTEDAKAAMAKVKADTAAVDASSGLIPFEALVKGRVNQLIEDGTYPGLEAGIEEAIANMEMLPEEQGGMGRPQLPPPDGGGEDQGMEGQKGEEADVTTDAIIVDGEMVRLIIMGDVYTFDELVEYVGHEDAAGMWEEEKHSRGQPDNKGKFGPGGGGSTGPTRNEKSRKAAAALGGKHHTDDLIKATPEQFVAARDKSTRSQFLSAHPAEELANHKLILNPQGTVGISVDPKGDVQNVFNNGGPKGGAAKAIVAAIEAGGNTLDCYEGHLSEYYHQFGFEEDSRMKFNREFAPEGWDFDKYGEPDIIFMSHRGYLNGETPQDALKRAADKSQWEAPTTTTNYGDDWDAAKEQSRTNAAGAGEAEASTGPDKAAAKSGGKRTHSDAGALERAFNDRSGSELVFRASEGAWGIIVDARPWDESKRERGASAPGHSGGEFSSGGGVDHTSATKALVKLHAKALKGKLDKKEKAQLAVATLKLNEAKAEGGVLFKRLEGIKNVKAMKGKGVAKATSEKSGKHPGKGYSKDAYIDSNGVMHTSNVYDAQRALFEDRRVELKQPKMVSTLIKRLGETAKEMAEAGSTAPTFNLCNVSIKGTNLFCADQIGVPRVEMPVIKASKTADFIKHLEDKGYDIEEGKEKAANLRASQSELSGEKVAAAMDRITAEGKFYKRIVISKDDYILDGHHTWAGQLAHDAADNDLENDGRQVKIARIDIGIVDLIKEAEKWTGGEGKKAASEKAKGLGDAIGEIEGLLRKLRILDKDWDEGKHPRNAEGEFGGGAANREAKSRAATAALAGKQPSEKDIAKELDPKVVEVGGDEWNKQTAIRLEIEYQHSKPAFDKLLTSYEKGPAEEKKEYGPDEDVPDEDEEEKEYEGTPAPEEWALISDDSQTQIENEYFDKALPDYIESEVNSWQESGGALDQAKSELVDDVEFVLDTVTDIVEGDGEELDEYGEFKQPESEAIKVGKPLKPIEKSTGWRFTSEQIANAITLRYNSDGEGNGKVTVNIDDRLLQEPVGVTQDPNQTEMEMGAKDYSKYLTGVQRAELKIRIVAEFEKQAEKNADKIEPPDFTDSAKEYMEQNWSEMGDNEKYEWAKYNTSIINDLTEEYEKEYAEFQETGKSIAGGGYIGTPEKFDPLNKTSGEDYKKTQRLARKMSLDRAVQVFEERDIEIGAGVEMDKAIARLDSDLWVAWKASSTSPEGQLLQVATADELGGRLNPVTGRGGAVKLDKDAIREQANKDYKSTGGYDGIKAYVRAKWETTQFLLDKAGMQELELYRGINLDPDKYEQAVRDHEVVRGMKKVPTLKVVRNGAASTTFNADIANGWSADDTRIVLRALMPRTAAISVPAYGINVKSEQEVVVAGTAWKKWDAWIKKAPRIGDVAMTDSLEVIDG